MKCPVCGTDNKEFTIRCGKCGAILQQRLKTLNLFETIFFMWRNPKLAQRRILLAEHRNLTLVVATIESFAAGFAFLYVVKATDTYSSFLPHLLFAGAFVSIIVYLPFFYLIPSTVYILSNIKKTGITIKGFVSAFIYAIHPIALMSLVLIPVQVAIFGQYFFSNNPPPQVINPLPFYALMFLSFIVVVSSMFFLYKLVSLVKAKPVRLFILIVGLVICAAFASSFFCKYILLT